MTLSIGFVSFSDNDMLNNSQTDKIYAIVYVMWNKKLQVRVILMDFIYNRIRAIFVIEILSFLCSNEE